MKRFFLVACFLSFMSIATAYAEHFAFKIGENRASFGVGLGWSHGIRGYSGTFNFPAASALVERSILPFRDFGFLSVGAQFGFHHGRRNHTGTAILPDFRESWTTFYFVPRLALYFHEVFHPDDFPENIDLFVGVGLGFRHVTQRFTNEVTAQQANRDDMRTGFLLGYHFFAGGRYYFRENMAVFAEIGWGLSFLNVGITIRY